MSTEPKKKSEIKLPEPTQVGFASLEEITKNKPRPLFIPKLGKYIKIRDPTFKDREEVLEECVRLPFWHGLSEVQKLAEVAYRLAIKTIIEPKIPKEKLRDVNEPMLRAILDEVHRAQGLRIELSETELRRFLETGEIGV